MAENKGTLQNLDPGDDVGDVTICGQTVEGVFKFVYLGSQHSSMGRCAEDVLRRIGIAFSAMKWHELGAKSLEASEALHRD